MREFSNWQFEISTCICCWWDIKIDLYLHREVPFDFLVCRGVLLLIDVYHLKTKFSPLRTPFPKKIERRNLEKSTFLENFLKCSKCCRNFCVLIVAEIYAARGAPPKITTFQDFNPRAIPWTFTKLWSSEKRGFWTKASFYSHLVTTYFKRLKLNFHPKGGFSAVSTPCFQLI